MPIPESFDKPWYQRVRRWGQTNITEIDPDRYDIDFWRQHWQRTAVQGVIINAGGIVAYYPSQYPLHYRAKFLNDRDLFHQVSEAAKAMGLAVLARMDSNRATESAWRENPQWFALDSEGQPYKVGDRYITCINSDYYDQFLPDILREIIARDHPDGFTDNSWSGLGRDSICYCGHCAGKFHDATGFNLPTKADWCDDAYRKWIKWSYDCRSQRWDFNNKVTRDAGGPHCLWLGMVNANPVACCRAFRDLKTLGPKMPAVMCDHQTRNAQFGFEENSLNGKILHDITNWDTLIPESMSMYTRGKQTFRITSNPPCESQLWMIEGIAGGISPWWHHIGAHHEDRRQYDTAKPVMQWHEQNEPFLYDRQPIANVGIAWSQDNIDFFGRDDAARLVDQPFRGFISALTRARIPFLPIHADHIKTYSQSLDVLILPNLAAMSDTQVDAVKQFVEKGGSLIATGQTSLYTQFGDRRNDFALADIFGAHATGDHLGSTDTTAPTWDSYNHHSYLRLTPSTITTSDTPTRHPTLSSFDQTDIIPFGGRLEIVSPTPDTQTLLTFIPPFPIYPPEFSWMRTEQTDTPALLLRTHNSTSRIAFLPADIDRCFAENQLPDHGDLLANIIRWAAHDNLSIQIHGPGYLDCHLYRQQQRLILHIINLSNTHTWPKRVEQFLPVGPLTVRIKWPYDTPAKEISLAVSQSKQPFAINDNWVSFEIKSIDAHEMAIIQ